MAKEDYAGGPKLGGCQAGERRHAPGRAHPGRGSKHCVVLSGGGIAVWDAIVWCCLESKGGGALSYMSCTQKKKRKRKKK